MKDLGLVRESKGTRFALGPKTIDLPQLNDVLAQYSARQDADRAKLERMAAYGQSASCRWRLLLEYFSEAEGFDRCGTCDNCVAPPDATIAPPVSRERAEWISSPAGGVTG